jgi:hypothetical protein
VIHVNASLEIDFAAIAEGLNGFARGSVDGPEVPASFTKNSLVGVILTFPVVQSPLVNAAAPAAPLIWRRAG